MNNPILNIYKDNKKRFGEKVKVIRANLTKIDTFAIIKEYNNTANNYFDDKIIYFDIKNNVQQGDLIEHNNNMYIILLQEESTNNIYVKYMARRCDNTIKIYINKKLYEIPCNIESFQQGIDEEKYIITGKGILKITMQDNKINNQIIEDMRIIKWGYAWKVIARTNENRGLSCVFFEKSLFNAEIDDRENEIADRWKNEIKHNYNLSIDTNIIQLEEEETKRLIVNVTDNVNGKIENVENPTLIYTYNKDIINIDDNGLITPLKKGETTIKIQFGNIESVVNIKIVGRKIVPINYYEIISTNKSSPTYIQCGMKRTFTINHYKNNKAQNNTFKFYLTDEQDNNTKLATIIKTETNKCIIIANDYTPGKVVLHCEDTTNKNIIKKTIEIQSIYASSTRKLVSIAINKDINAVKVGGNVNLRCRAKNEEFEYSGENVFWYSNNKNIARVDEMGKVTGVSKGTCNIFVYTLDSKFSDEIQINVN